MAKKKTKALDEFVEAGEGLLADYQESIPEPVKAETYTPKPAAVAKPAPKPKAKVEIKSAIQQLSFDRWFPTTGRPGHHKAGMRAFVKTSGRKTKIVWDKLFAKY